MRWIAESFGALVPIGAFGVFGGRGVAKEKRAVGFECAMDFSEELGDVREMMRSSSAGDDVESGVGIGDVLGINDFKADVLDIAICGDFRGLFQHAFSDVGCDDGLAERSNSECGEAGSSCDVEADVIAAKRSEFG